MLAGRPPAFAADIFPTPQRTNPMKRILTLIAVAISLAGAQAEPLRVFIRGGEKNRGQEVHAHPRFLAEWKTLLAERGMTVDGGIDWPTPEQAAKADVIVAYAQDGGNATAEQEKVLEAFVKRGGGLVVIHTASVSFTNPGWWRDMIGGAWVPKQTNWKEGPMDLYYTENQYIGGGHPITKGAANFHLDDEIYYDMDVKPEARVLAASYTPNVKEGKKPAAGGKAHIYDIQPQMWAYEKDGYRAFVSIPGHLFKTFGLPHYRAVLLRGIAWAGKRANVDEFCKPEEISSLTYPEGGPQKPEQTLANLEVHPDFTMKLVTSEPLISKPMNFDWDPAGRLWVAETPEYPNGRRGMRPDYRGKEWKDHGGIDPTPGEQTRPAHDKISILTDSNGDGVMDKKDVFYEGLDLVTGFVFHKDGVIVTQAPDVLFLCDTNGDGKADKVEKLYSGLGTGDTHAVINNPRWGWDGWIYATHGYSGSGDVTNGDGSKHFGRIGSGVVRFKPDGSAFEQYSSKGGNTWGLTITADNRVMWTQPTSGALLMQTVLPEYALARGKIGNTPSYNVVEPSLKTFPLMPWEQLAYVQIDWVGSFTAAAGCAIYDGGTWPAEYNGDYFTTEPTINIIHHARLTPQGSSYTFHKLPGREETEFVRSKDMWWRPIEARIGPDGALYIADFYNQAVIHNDTRGPDHNKVNAAVRPDRDHYFGRIWKIDHKNAKRIALPNLAPEKVSLNEIGDALSHPNSHVRKTAHRLLVERMARDSEARSNTGEFPASVAKSLRSPQPEARIAGLWTMHGVNLLAPEQFAAALADPDPAVRRNAALAAEVLGAGDARAGLLNALKDSDGSVRVTALRALASEAMDEKAAAQLVAAWSKFDDDFQCSAAVGAASRNPAGVITAALDSSDAASLTPLVSALTQNLTEAADAAKLVVALAAKPASADALKRSILGTLGTSLKAEPAMTPELSSALGKLLASGASGSALPLAAKWDKAGALKGEIRKLTDSLLAEVADTKATDAARTNAANSLLGLRSTNAEILPAVFGQLEKDGSMAFKRSLVIALGETGAPRVGAALAAAFDKLPAEAQAAAFDTLLKRPEWAIALLDAAKAKTVTLTNLGPANLNRLRTHPDRGVSRRATELLDELNPTAKAKKETIAKLMAAIEQKGDAAKGKALFATACAICHKFGDVGADIGPGLTGMGAHGAGELLSAIVDPNAEVDPSFVQWNIETKDGQAFAGIIAAENPTSITMRSLAGVQEIKVAAIKSRVNTGRSLMPEGFEGLGGETLRDIIAYMQSVDGGRFRTLDLRDAFTTTTARGLYMSEATVGDSFVFNKTGTVSVGGIPFNIVAPEKAANGKNIIVLKGGPSRAYSKTLPQKAEVKAGGFKANRLHFLGGVTGWGFQNNNDTSDVLKITVHSTAGQRETIVCKNGVEFSDYFNRVDVPGSKFADGLVKQHQMRWFTKPLAQTHEIDRITIESFDTNAAPTIVAITAELADANAPLPAVPTPEPSSPKKPRAAKNEPTPAGLVKTGGGGTLVLSGTHTYTGSTTVQTGTLVLTASSFAEDANFKPQFDDAVPQPPAAKPANGPRVLIVGGGSSHDFVKFFGGTDKATLAPVCGWVDFTQNANGVPAILDRVDVLVWSANQPISSATKKALMDYANRGGAIVAHHPGTWYAWRNFPEWNAQITGGGARGHDRLGPYSVTVTNASHPITRGVPATFEITDELYHFVPDEKGTPIEVLATATSTQKPGTYPQVFVVKHPKARIVGFTLGHDARAHDLPAYQTLLKNAVQWAAGK